MAAQPIPPDPFTALAASASQLHELYGEFVKAGFSELQAFALTTKLLTESMRVAAPCQHCGRIRE